MRLTTLLLVAALSFVNLSSAKQKTASQKAGPNYLNEPFDLAAKKLPPGYAGADVEAIYKRLEERKEGEKKGEFETTEEFNSRVNAARGRAVVGTITPDSLIGIVIEKAETKYDADTKTMGVSVKLENTWDGVGLDEETRAIPSRIVWGPTRTYEASNAYGAKATVEKTTFRHYQMKVINYKEFPLKQEEYGDPELRFEVLMDVSEARTAKENIRALAVVKLRPPFIGEGYLHSKPTITKPSEVFAVYEYLVCELQAVIVYNVSTGQIYTSAKKL